MASSMSNLHDSDFRSVASSLLGNTATVTAGSRPGSSLKSARSEANLRADYLKNNISSTSLAAPPPPAASLGDLGLDTPPRPATAHSMRNLGSNSTKPSLEISVAKISTPTFGTCAPPLKSSLGQYEPLASPVKSDTTSLFGDETPESIAQEIASRIAREEEMERLKTISKEEDKKKRLVQAELEAQRRRNVDASKQTMVYPSPPASIESESDKSGATSNASRSSPRLLGGSFQDMNRRPVPRPGPRPQVSGTNVSDDERPGSRAGRVFRVDGSSSPASSPRLPSSSSSSSRDAFQGSNASPQRRMGNPAREAPGPQMLRPQGATEAPISKQPPRSPLFQQMNPFDVHSDDDEIDDKKSPAHANATATANTTTFQAEDRRAPYGIPSPPLSHHQRPSDEEEESMPIIRTVEAKRGTILVGGPGRTSLGLQIEEFERTLQQAQAMSALENKAGHLSSTSLRPSFEIMTSSGNGMRHRADSNASSNYSEMSESPMTIEPPLVSPKPFPLSPRPMGPAVRSQNNALADAHPSQERPSLESSSERTFGPYRRETDDSAQTTRRPTLDDLPESPASSTTRQPLRPRMKPLAAGPMRQPTLEEYGKTKVSTGRGGVHRPSPGEYGPVRIKRTESPFRSESSFSNGSGSNKTFRMDSPILKVVRNGLRQDSTDSSDVTESVATSRTNSPVPTTSTGSYSVFSPPQSASTSTTAAKRTANFPTSLASLHPLQPEWYGPAPTAPPTSPLPIPERSARRKNTLEVRSTPSQGKPVLSPGLASSASILPNTDANPNWPLPGPSAFVFPAPTAMSASPPQRQQLSAGNVESGFGARRSLLRDKRAPPAPLNIAATKYSDEGDLTGAVGANSGPWTPDAIPSAHCTSPTSLEERRILPTSTILRPSTAGDGSSIKASRNMEATFQQNDFFGEDKSSAIGVARGLSIRYDRMREREGRGRSRTRDRVKQKQLAAAWRLDEQDDFPSTSGPSSPVMGEALDRFQRPNHGLNSATGIADGQGIRFI